MNGRNVTRTKTHKIQTVYNVYFFQFLFGRFFNFYLVGFSIFIWSVKLNVHSIIRRNEKKMIECTQNDEKFVGVAVIEAEKSALGARLGCVAVVSGKIIARGFNHYRTFSKDGLLENTCSCHAEMDVLRKCLKQNKTRKLSLYVVRVSKMGKLACSTPCINCWEKMQLFQIKTITYINTSGEAVKQQFNDFHATHRSSGYNAIQNKRVKCI